MPRGSGELRRHLLHGAQHVVESFPRKLGSEAAEIYVLSFRIWRTDYDARRPYVAIGYNTESQYRRELERRRAPDPGEIRWSYAFWLLEGFDTLGNVPEDPTGSALYVAEAKELGLWYEDGADEPDTVVEGTKGTPRAGGGRGAGLSEEEQDARDELLDLHFAGVCIELARDLHASGRITAVLNRPVPIVIFDMDCPGWEVEATLAANPPELIADYRTHHESAGKL